MGPAHVGMRSMMFILLLASACAATPRVGANIPAIRHQIDDAIAADPSLAHRTANFEYDGAPAPRDAAPQLPASRRITAMGHVEPDRAIVYTKPGNTKLEETWVREPDGWKLSRVKELDDASRASAAR
jgi:hypothetical protein